MAAGESALDTTRSLRVYAAQSSSWELRSSGRMRTAVARRCCSCSSRRTVLRRRSRCAPASACSCAILVSGAVSPASCAVIVWKQRQWRWVTMMRPGICVQAALLSHPGTDMIAHLITCLLQPQPLPPRRLLQLAACTSTTQRSQRSGITRSGGKAGVSWTADLCMGVRVQA